jgi:hypothetical protein
MKKLLKVILPPFVGFAIFFLMVRYSSWYFDLKIDQMGAGNIISFMAFYRYMLPLLFAVAVLTQLLIVVPVWRRLKGTHGVAKVNAIVDTIFVCLFLAFCISYPISYPQVNSGHFFKLLCFMSLVQMVYWTINLFILHLLEGRDWSESRKSPKVRKKKGRKEV